MVLSFAESSGSNVETICVVRRLLGVSGIACTESEPCSSKIELSTPTLARFFHV